MKILINFASRSRPEKFFAHLENISLLSVTEPAIAATLDLDDESMNNDEVKNKLKQYKNVTPFYGCSADKIDAINRSVPMMKDWDILINTSDDMVFIHGGFDEEIINDFKQHFPDTDGVIHYPDGYVQNKLMTMSIMGRKYYERFGYVYHPDYVSLWCDNEAQDVAKILGKYVYIDKPLFRHEHPLHNGGKSVMDELYRENESYFNKDKETYYKRKAKNFDLP